MSEVIGYLGKAEAQNFLMQGLKRLEFYKYDSVGISLLSKRNQSTYKLRGRVRELEANCIGKDMQGNLGIAHTRWATNGQANNTNAHPHTSRLGHITLVHNGVIENYEELKKEVEERGYPLKSETDSEVLACLIEDIYISTSLSLQKSVAQALTLVEGAYSVLVTSKNDITEIVAAKYGMPLAFCKSGNELFLSSKASLLIDLDLPIKFLNDQEVACFKDNGDWSVLNLTVVEKHQYTQEIDSSLMSPPGLDRLSAILNQPKVVENCLRGRLNSDEMSLYLPQIQNNSLAFRNATRIIFITEKSTLNLGLIGKNWLEDLTLKTVHLYTAVDFCEDKSIVRSDDVIISLTDTGEEINTLAAIAKAKGQGAFVLNISNSISSSISDKANASLYIRAGRGNKEIFTSQLVGLYMVAVELGKLCKKLSKTEVWNHISEIVLLASRIEETLVFQSNLDNLVRDITVENQLIIEGTSEFGYPLANQSARYFNIHSNIYTLGVNNIAENRESSSTIPKIIVANTVQHHKAITNQLVKAKKTGAYIVAIAQKDDIVVKRIADKTIGVIPANEQVSVILSAIALQLLSYQLSALIEDRNPTKVEENVPNFKNAS
jgi:glucosamine--fructose-6-phosphate aminotransferase (isomerizing)